MGRDGRGLGGPGVVGVQGQVGRGWWGSRSGWVGVVGIWGWVGRGGGVHRVGW